MIKKTSDIVTGIDIGSSKVSGVVADMDKSGAFQIIGHATYPLKGVSRGEVVDLGECVDSVAKVLNKLAAKTAAKKLSDIYVNISGPSVKGERSKGMIPLSLRGREVTKFDMDRCVNAASTIQLPLDREIIHRIVNCYSINDQPNIKNPLGLYASRLYCDIYVITAGITHLQNIYKCINDAGFDTTEIVYSGIADGAAILAETEKEDGVVLVNMGASLTEVSIFYGGVLSDLDVMGVGGQDFKGNVAESPELNNVANRISARAAEFINRGGKVRSVVLTGGVSYVDGVIEKLEERLAYPMRMGVAKEIRGDISSLDSIRLTTAIGLIKYVSAEYKRKVLETKNVAKRLSTKIVEIFNNYF